ncbi:MAG: CsgG/HfaB family protein [Phycisphaerae bacterium]|nr:CsgG/HfaB family protein [Phycisphaerae bacterium]
MRISRNPRAVAAALALSAVFLGGCTKKILIIQYPVFWDAAPKTIAITDFKNLAGTRGQAQAIANELSAALTANGTYKIFNRQHFSAVEKEIAIRQAFSSDESVAANTMAKLGKVQAIITGSVNSCSATSRRQTKRRPVYRTNRKKQLYISHYVPYTYFHNEANIQVSATLIRIDRGRPRTIYSAQAVGRATSSGEHPRMDPYACLAIARRQVMWQLLSQFAIIRKTIKVNQSKAFRTTSGLPYDGKWPYTDRFSAKSDKMYVMIKLPPECDRNRFRITIARKGVPKNIASTQVKWTRAMSAVGTHVIFSPRKIAQESGGPGGYVVKFYSGSPKPVMTHNITITP